MAIDLSADRSHNVSKDERVKNYIKNIIASRKIVKHISGIREVTKENY